MNRKKRILVIFVLIVFIFLVFFLSDIYEKRLYIRENESILDNQYDVFKSISGFKLINQERYVSYYDKHNNLSYEDVVSYVNIGLDKEYYSYFQMANLKNNHFILVNKYNKLSSKYIPFDLEVIDDDYFVNGNGDARSLRKEAKIAFERLSSDSVKNGTPVYGQSAYRSFDRQNDIYMNSLKSYGKDKTDNEVARPGFSEHQTGLAIDVSSNKSGNMLSFADTPSFLWMTNNCYKYGFILRYPLGKEKIHGYIYEPWHYRYVGLKVSFDIHNNHSDLTYDEYYYKFIENKKD